MTSPSVVRIATLDDHQEVWRLFLQSHNENGLFQLAPEKVEWILLRLLNPASIPPGDTGLRGIIGVIGSRGRLEAVCGLCINTLWYSNEKHLADFLLFVDPEYRTTKHAITLINWMKSQSDALKLPLMSGVVTNERTEAKCRLFRRMVPKVGESFLYAGQLAH